MNTLTVVCGKLIYKRYGLAEKCQNEFMAWKQFNQIVPDNVPNLVVKKDDLCIFEYLQANPTKMGKKELSRKAGLLMAEIYKNYNPQNYKKGVLWEVALNQLINEFESISKTLVELGYKNFSKLLMKNLKKIESTNFGVITFLHRDIHKGNVIQEENNFYLIDHEHAMEGPIELELQNSLFWNDRMSLNPKIVKDVLREQGIPYSQKSEDLLATYYLADQLVLAVKDNKLSKVRKLIKKAYNPISR